MSIAQQVLDDLNKALEIDLDRAFEAGRLFEREQAFDAHQESYRRGTLDIKTRILDAIKEEENHMALLNGHYLSYKEALTIAERIVNNVV